VKRKYFRLYGGWEKERGEWWIECVVERNGSFRNKGLIKIRTKESCYRKNNRYGKKNQWGKIYLKTWRKENPEKIAKYTHKRRKLGFIPLNKKFPHSHAHHINKIVVIYIPERMHQTHKHNVYTGVGMDKINFLAFNFLWKQCVSNSNE